jgi:uncharacterized protein (DUF1330 family)
MRSIIQTDEEEIMSSYIVFTREETIDPRELEIYWEKIRATFEGHAVTVLASYGRCEILEGEPTEGVVIAEFPDFDSAKAWYDSPAYREVRVHRQKGARYRGLLVDGVGGR